ncbi:MAG TPA: tetratricopeptide repeat protein, partial [Desulfurivibrio alkaliphilus]|nr:tetratricopeptide repeat protein [Desulfurivibrio alkaliphilus]
MLLASFWLVAIPGPAATPPAPVASQLNQWSSQAALLEQQRNWPELLKHSFRWSRAIPNDHQAWFNMGLAQEQLALADKAMGSYRQALRLNPQFAPAWYNLGVLLREAGRTNE